MYKLKRTLSFCTIEPSEKGNVMLRKRNSMTSQNETISNQTMLKNSSSRDLTQSSLLSVSDPIKKFNYIGEFKNKKKNGFGIQTFKDTSNYTGHWKDDKMDGLGILKGDDNEILKGFFLQDKLNGYGIQNNNSYVYEGLWENQIKENLGKFFLK